MVALFHTTSWERQLGCLAITPHRILPQKHLKPEALVVTYAHQRHPVSAIIHQPPSPSTPTPGHVACGQVLHMGSHKGSVSTKSF